MHPDSTAGQNSGSQTSHTGKGAPTAYDIKALHSRLQDFSDNELKQIIILPQGDRLKQGATYIDLMDVERKEFAAMGDMEATDENCYVAKTEVGYPIWNRLVGIENPDRLDQPS